MFIEEVNDAKITTPGEQTLSSVSLLQTFNAVGSFFQNRIFNAPKSLSWNRKKKNTGVNLMNWLKAEDLFRGFTIIVTAGANVVHSATGASIMHMNKK
jgi:hypothetical protein